MAFKMMIFFLYIHLSFEDKPHHPRNRKFLALHFLFQRRAIKFTNYFKATNLLWLSAKKKWST